MICDVRKMLDERGIKPWRISYSSLQRIIRLRDAALSEYYFGRNIDEFDRIVKEKARETLSR